MASQSAPESAPKATITRTEQAMNTLLARITGGELSPGSLLPNEFKLAEELGVSQGTARKAIGLLEARGIIERQQGRGTFVAQTTPEKALFKFFRVRRRDGTLAQPSLIDEKLEEREATLDECDKLGVTRVLQIDRHRGIEDCSEVRERIILPAPLFPRLFDHSPLPNALYALFEQQYGITIGSAPEELTSEVESGEAILVVERVTNDLVGRCVELRTSRYRLSDALVYAV